MTGEVTDDGHVHQPLSQHHGAGDNHGGGGVGVSGDGLGCGGGGAGVFPPPMPGWENGVQPDLRGGVILESLLLSVSSFWAMRETRER